jgi:DNA polymerase
MATFHPAFLLRSPLQKRLAWRDFLAVKKALDEPVSRPRPIPLPQT